MTPTDAELVAALGRACARLAERDDSRTMTLRFVLQQVGMSDPGIARILFEEMTRDEGDDLTTAYLAGYERGKDRRTKETTDAAATAE